MSANKASGTQGSDLFNSIVKVPFGQAPDKLPAKQAAQNAAKSTPKSPKNNNTPVASSSSSSTTTTTIDTSPTTTNENVDAPTTNTNTPSDDSRVKSVISVSTSDSAIVVDTARLQQITGVNVPLNQRKLNLAMIRNSRPTTQDLLSQNITPTIEAFTNQKIVDCLLMAKRMPFAGSDFDARIDNNCHLASESIKAQKGVNFDAGRDLRVVQEQRTNFKSLRDILFACKAAEPKANWDTFLVACKSHVRDSWLGCTNHVVPKTPAFLYSKAYFSACTFQEALDDWEKRFNMSMKMLTAIFVDPSKGPQMIEEMVERAKTVNPEVLKDHTWDEGTELANNDGATYAVFMLCGSYFIDAKYLTINEEYKKQAKGPNHKKYRKDISKCYVKIISLWQWLSGEERDMTKMELLDIVAGSEFASYYWECLRQVRSCLRQFKNHVLGRTARVTNTGNKHVYFDGEVEKEEMLEEIRKEMKEIKEKLPAVKKPLHIINNAMKSGVVIEPVGEEDDTVEA